jgi:hypothetical protein
MLRTNKNYIVSVFLNHLVNYPTVIYLWHMGFSLNLFLFLLALLGNSITLVFFYVLKP